MSASGDGPGARRAHLLMLSGIGEEEVLRKAGVEWSARLPVGQHCADRPLMRPVSPRTRGACFSRSASAAAHRAPARADPPTSRRCDRDPVSARTMRARNPQQHTNAVDFSAFVRKCLSVTTDDEFRQCWICSVGLTASTAYGPWTDRSCRRSSAADRPR